MDPESKVLEKTEAEVWNAISAFEQILEAIPNDRVALQTIYEAYEMIGDQAHALEYLLRLAGVIVDEADPDAAAQILEALDRIAPDTEEARVIRPQLEGLLRESAVKDQPGEEAAASADQKTGNIKTELNLAWNLKQAGELSNEEYSSVVQDLSDTWSKDIGVPVSVLHVLEDRESKNTDKVLLFLSKDTGTPIIALSQFDLSREACALLPSVYLFRRGAIPFGFIGKELMVAVLNPYDKELREEVRQAAKRPCHFYLVSAAEYNLALETVRKNNADE